MEKPGGESMTLEKGKKPKNASLHETLEKTGWENIWASYLSINSLIS